PVLDNLHTAYALVHVDPAHQRRGVGRALDAAVVDKARSLGRRLVMTEAYAPPEGDSPGLLFARAMGYAVGLEDRMKVVDLFGTEASGTRSTRRRCRTGRATGSCSGATT